MIFNFLSEHLPPAHSIIADLHDEPPFTFPLHIASTDHRPDIVIWNDATKTVTLLELTVCHESNFLNTHQRKITQYLDLECDIQRSHFRVTTCPIQVGCTGFVDLKGFERVKQITTRGVGVRTWKNFLQEVALVTIQASHNIWTSRNYKINYI